jgi:hypoxanthine phosphoribosyltransferase
MSNLYISWPSYHQKIESIAIAIYQSKWQFNQVICLARGGLRVGDILSRIYNIPLAILSASSYGGSGGSVRGELNFSHDLAMTTDHLGSNVLLVDDLVDSGVTLERSILWLKEHYGADIVEIRTAVIWYKACSIFAPDYFVDYLPDNPWIHQPFEVYEEMTIEDLLLKSQAE